MGFLHDAPPRIASSLFPGVYSHGAKGGVYLTFDDGPDPATTPLFLKVLDSYRCPATFFLVGSRVREHPDLAREIVGAGHLTAMHCLSHIKMMALPSLTVSNQIQNTRDIFRDALMPQFRMLRPPYGRIGPGVFAAARRQELSIVLWSISARDWETQQPDKIARRVLKHLKDTDVILLHDSGSGASTTLAALPMIIDGIREKRLELSTLKLPDR